MEKAYGYLRVSGLGQVNGDGFDRQKKAIQAYADKAGFEVVRYFEEKGVSGTTGEEDRPAFQEMVAEILKNGVRTIIVEGLDRLARELRVQESLLVFLASKGIALHSARTEEDVTAAVLQDPMKKALVQMQGVFGELEKSMLVKKLRAARDRQREQTGKCEGRKFFDETAEGREVLAEIKRLRRKKKGTTRTPSNAEISAALNERGMKSSIGKKFTASIVGTLVRGMR